MSKIIKNEPCQECRKNGHDKSGNHLMRFEDGGGYCSRGHFHTSKRPYYEAAGTATPLDQLPITGDIKYSPGEFRDLEQAGKLRDPLLRAMALGGMRMADRWEVMTGDEQEAKQEEWDREVEWFGELSRKHLVDRGIHGLVASLYNIRVGHDGDKKVNRHYYPRYEEGVQVGAKCRTLPKDFSFGHLGKLFGDQDLFGMHIAKKIADSGQRRGICVLVGGEPDTAAAQQMFIKELNGLEGLNGMQNLDGVKLFHVYSPNKGEQALEEFIHNKPFLSTFNTIVMAFDNDETGDKLAREFAKIMRGAGPKLKKLVMPNGCKDPNDCLKQGRDKEFVNAVFNAQEQLVRGKLKRVADVKAKAREMVAMGKDYWLNGFNRITFGIRLHYLAVWGAGTGVGKTDTTMAHVENLMNMGEDVVVIYLENQKEEVARTFAGMLVGKDFNSPPQTQEELDAGAEYNPARDYTQQDLDDALDQLDNQDRLLIADLDGSKDVDAVMECMQDAMAQGYKYFVVDNLTAFEHKNDKGQVATGVQAIDETMKRIGTFKDENPVNIFLLSHLVKVGGNGRISHTQGGEVYESDFRGAGSITFWANAVWGIERNTMAKVFRNKCITLYRNLKNRGIGHMVGSVVIAEKDIRTGRYTELVGETALPEIGRDGDNKPKEQRERDNFDDGSSKAQSRGDRTKPIPLSEPKADGDGLDLPFDEDALG